MYTKEAYNSLLKSTAQNIDISDEMFEAAEKTYKDLGKWIDQETPDYEISIYPQGSFALGTVAVRPITNADDYDLDIVCQFKSQYGLDSQGTEGRCGLNHCLSVTKKRVGKLKKKRDAGMLNTMMFQTFIWMLFLLILMGA
ncbi:MAG: hypothetical protein ACLU3U_07415 [Gallintestinimicrobium sp.]